MNVKVPNLLSYGVLSNAVTARLRSQRPLRYT